MNRSQQQIPQAEPDYDYSNRCGARDFDILIEVAEQQEMLRQSQQLLAADRWRD
jgi:hypothetical protein